MNTQPTKPFLCSYHHDGAWWCVTIQAYDMADAKARVQKLGFLKLDGEITATVSDKYGFFAKAYCWFKNLAQ